MSSPYGPPGGPPQWGQRPPGPGPYQGGVPQAGPAYGRQPGYPAPSYGAPGYGYGPPPGFGPGAPVPGKKKRSALPWVLSSAVLVVVAAVVLVLGFVTPGWFVRTVFDAASVEQGVQQTLEGSYRLGAVESVTCPSGQAVRAQTRFDCQVSVNGAEKTVTVTVKNDKGVYEVGHPR
ncbi:DUF4333 domain-containing protein [Saccharopolyspora taberi]|uniref:DUF4333 domain-containing protein n=1 Tax=Saccharopolyspora taberi TaxID=60895 RepID=A0ABN3VIA3_9PSEU